MTTQEEYEQRIKELQEYAEKLRLELAEIKQGERFHAFIENRGILGRMRTALLFLKDEAERILLAAQDEGENLPHLEKAIKQADEVLVPKP